MQLHFRKMPQDDDHDRQHKKITIPDRIDQHGDQGDQQCKIKTCEVKQITLVFLLPWHIYKPVNRKGDGRQDDRFIDQSYR